MGTRFWPSGQNDGVGDALQGLVALRVQDSRVRGNDGGGGRE